MRIGILCPSEIAFRRFMPAVQKAESVEYIGVAHAARGEWAGSLEEMEFLREAGKAQRFENAYGEKVFCGYQNILESGEIDAVYIPLPPALHYKWAKAALENGLHVFVEKPFAACMEETEELIRIAREKRLALHENYMFAFHSQIEEIADAVSSGKIGTVRLYRVDFGFPRRGGSDFRYKKEMGGGALMDCGGYVLKYGDMLLGRNAEVVQAGVVYEKEGGVEIFGSGIMKNDSGITVQIAFGMDNDYRCSVDAWGSCGTLSSRRVFTAPAGFEPFYTISRNGEMEEWQMNKDDAFYKSIMRFQRCTKNSWERMDNYRELLRQQQLVEEFARLAGMRK